MGPCGEEADLTSCEGPKSVLFEPPPGLDPAYKVPCAVYIKRSPGRLLVSARDAGLDIPRDLSVVSFDNTPLVRFTTPPLTAVDQPISETTATAVRLLIQAQRDGADPAPTVVLPMSLVERGSTAAPRG